MRLTIQTKQEWLNACERKRVAELERLRRTEEVVVPPIPIEYLYEKLWGRYRTDRLNQPLI